MSKKKVTKVVRPVPSKPKKEEEELNVDLILNQKNLGAKIDIGCGGNKQGSEWIGMDYRKMPGVDIVHDITMFPWPIPDEAMSLAVTSHVIEHINPAPVDPRITGLAKMLLEKKIVTQKDLDKYVGEIAPGPLFMRFMDEVWRILKPGGEFLISLPYAGSPGYYQDPSHINPCTEITWLYFDPKGHPMLDPTGVLYSIYKVKPWRIKINAWHVDGNMEVVLIKRPLNEEK